jgi:hypothetical protein
MSESGTPHPKWLLVILAPLIVSGAIFVTMNTISPLSAGPAGVLFLFCLIYLWCLSVLFALLYAGSRLAMVRGWGSIRALRAHRAYYVASVVACFPVMLLAIASIGQIDIISIGLVGLFVALATFYVLRRT